MSRDVTRLPVGVRLLLALPTVACLQLPGWWRLVALVPATVAVVGGWPRWRVQRDWDVPGQDGRFPYDVVGVQHHAEQMRSLLAGHDLSGAGLELVLPATLVAEPTNPVDPHAVAIHIDGSSIGHLAPGLAAEVQPSVLELNSAGLRPRINALVIGRTDEHGRTTLRVRLDLAGADVLRPAPRP